jgi:hypothetical protein
MWEIKTTKLSLPFFVGFTQLQRKTLRQKIRLRIIRKSTSPVPEAGTCGAHKQGEMLLPPFYHKFPSLAKHGKMFTFPHSCGQYCYAAIG